MTLLLLHDITFHYRWSQPRSASSGPAPAPPPTSPASCPLRRPISVARQIMCCATRWPRCVQQSSCCLACLFPLAALPDPRKDFLDCGGGSGRAERMLGPANFSRSFA